MYLLDLPRLFLPAIGLDPRARSSACLQPEPLSEVCTEHVRSTVVGLTLILLPLRATVACEASEDQWEPPGYRPISLMRILHTNFLTKLKLKWAKRQ